MPTDPHTDAAPPADLVPFFAALGARADQIPVGTAEGARQRGQRRRYRHIASYMVIMLLVAGTAIGTVLFTPRPKPPAQPLPKPTGTFIPLRAVGTLPMDIPFPDPVRLASGEVDPEVSATIIDGVAYVRVGGSGTTPLRVGALDLATGDPVFPTIDLGRWDSGPDVIPHRDGLLVRGDPQDGPGERLTMLDPATGAVRWERVLHQDLITRDGVIVATESGDVVGLDWRTGDERWRLAYPGAHLLSFGFTSTPTLPAPAGFESHQDARVAFGVGDSIDVIDTRTGQRVGAVTLAVGHQFRGLIEDTLFAGIGRELWAYPITGDGRRTLAYTAPEGQEAFALPCGESLLCVLANPEASGEASIVVLDRETYRKREGWQLDSIGSAVGDRFLTLNGTLHDLNGVTIGRTGAEELLSWWLTPGSALTLSLSGSDEFTAMVGGMRTQDGTWIPLGQFPLGQQPAAPHAWLVACGIDTHYLVCPARDGFHAWQFATG